LKKVHSARVPDRLEYVYGFFDYYAGLAVITTRMPGLVILSYPMRNVPLTGTTTYPVTRTYRFPWSLPEKAKKLPELQVKI
jgi:hypothetical protein